ncbi:TMEM175 family protein [Paraglaciecola arctica]|uniref:TMEM175 family protein n=1 Tax=Paraglaciecola arctica TaxID=1128911 RepID=UPI001C075ACC|nr:TMEM175 family protein [Paraglaciecola arctica]MBU3003828.1 DUF1211 domain-containing protein [Paraglaciecola arctica]
MNKPTASPFKMRGDNMTRIETFVAAAFAFAVTMLVISVGSVPETMQDFVDATKQIPAFTASCALIMWIWHSHAVWCRRYGLEDGMTIFLSSGLIILVLTYIYPLRLMMQALFSSVSNGYFPMEMTINFVWELRFMFAFYAIGFLLLSINFVALYLYAHRKRNDLGLDEVECFDTQTEIYIWSIGTGIGAISLLFSLILPADFIGFSGYVLFALFPFLYGLGFYRTTKRASIVAKVV